MLLRPLLPLACLALATCGDPFAAGTGSEGPPTGAIRVDVAVPGVVTADEDGFQVATPYFTLPFGSYGGSAESPDLPEGLQVRLGFADLGEWCRPTPASRLVTIVPGDTIQVAFTVNCDLVVRPVYYVAYAHPDTLPPFSVGVTVGLIDAFTLTTGVRYLDSVPANLWPVSVTVPAGCHRDPADDTMLRMPVFPPDTVVYVIDVICGP
jgi:hypothetical protein